MRILGRIGRGDSMKTKYFILIVLKEMRVGMGEDMWMKLE